jgi:pimeloyl-ACP methyl ester carboxylesterase
MEIDQLEDIPIGDTVQSIRIRGAAASNPVLLLVQQGPGLPMINEARRFERRLGLEEVFTVVYWDQRGCGRSLRTPTPAADITLEHMTKDTVSLLELLCTRFAATPYIAGFSLGASIAVQAAARRPDLVSAVVAVGADIDGVAAATHAYDFALTSARARGNRRAIRQLEAIGPPPHLTVEQFSTRARWAMNFGGVATDETYRALARSLLASLVRSPDYSPRDIARTVRGSTRTQAALLAELATLDLLASVPRLAVPIVVVQGRFDQVAPSEAALRYVEDVKAANKQLVWFRNSAHMPHLEEPARFREVLLGVRATELTLG